MRDENTFKPKNSVVKLQQRQDAPNFKEKTHKLKPDHIQIKDQNDFGLFNNSSESYKTMDKFLHNPKNKTKKQQQKTFLKWILYLTINCEC